MNNNRKRTRKMVYLSDLRSISQQEYETACKICEKIRKIRELRPLYIQKYGIDPEIGLPGGLWSEDARDPNAEPWNLVSIPTYDVINRLRLYSQSFTGYQLTSFSSSYQKPILHPIPQDFDETLKKIASKCEIWASRHTAITRNIPKDVIASPPKILGEIGYEINGNVINYDTYVYQERLNLLYETGVINWLQRKIEVNGTVNILEIGGGYGGLAYYIKHLLPKANYFICDLPESLLFASLYLALASPDSPHHIYDGEDKSIFPENDSGFTFIANFMFDDFTKLKKIDLAINTLSFSEMSEKQVRYYADIVSRSLGIDGLMFEQNFDLRHQNRFNPKQILCEYFKYRKEIRPKTIPVLTQGVADIWTSEASPTLYQPRVKRWFFNRYFKKNLSWWLRSKIYHVTKQRKL